MPPVDVAIESLRAGAPWYGAAVGATTLLIRAYRTPTIQAALPLGVRWSRLPRIVRQLTVAVAAAATSWLASLASGQPPRAALVAALPVALGAIGAHKATKAAGHAHTRRALAVEGATYEPGAVRKAVSPVLPICHKRIDIMRRLHDQRNGDGEATLDELL